MINKRAYLKGGSKLSQFARTGDITHVPIMPAPIAADWSALRAMYVKGVPAKQIAEQAGISFPALRQRISRERWDDDVTKAVTAMSHAVTRSLEQAATRWVSEIDDFVCDTLQSMKRRNKDSLALKDLKTLI